jgi:hypothetical protein
MSNPFVPGNDQAYEAWRSAKLRNYPVALDDLVVPVKRLDVLSRGEESRIRHVIGRANMALVRCTKAGDINKESLLRFCRMLGLERLDGNLCADDDAVSTLKVSEVAGATEYIPYTSRPLSWHTDGYYNAADRQVRAWALLCQQDAAEGGENALLDHEILYILLRDADPALVEALMAPDAMRIPANRRGDREIRPARLGPVFSIHPADGTLHMRYSARARNIEWRRDGALRVALSRMDHLFSSDTPYIFRHRLEPGECLISNNVLHNRSGFRDDPVRKRLLFRVRYYDRVRTEANTGSGARS